MRKKIKDSRFRLLPSLKLIKVFVFVSALLVGCNNDDVEVMEVLDGNTVRLSNGSKINLLNVVKSPDNAKWLEKNVRGKSVTLLDKEKVLIEEFNTGNISAYLFTDEGVNVNKALTDQSGPSKIPNGSRNPHPGEGIPLSELYDQYRSAVFLIFTSTTQNTHQGTGFFISADGVAISNYHVFANTLKKLAVIRTSDGNEYKIDKVLSYSQEMDFIVFKVSGLKGQTNFFPLARKTPPIGTPVFTIGNPKGLESTLSTGIISSLREEGTIIQTTTEITHGSSGGPLLNMAGEVIGITTAGLGEANLNFAINIQALKLDSLVK